MEVVYSLVGSLLVAVVTAFVTVRLSLSNFYSQKWWERKAEVYSTILEALASTVVGYQSILQGAHKNKDARKLIDDRHKEAKFRIDQLRHGGAFVISDEVDKHLQDLDVKRRDIGKRIQGGSADGGVKEYFEAESDALQEAINDIRECGKRELQGRTWWKRLLCG